MDISERAFETYIVNHLVQAHGYRLRQDDKQHRHYSKEDCLDFELVLEFITSTQPETWRALRVQHGSATEQKFRARLTSEIAKRGTLDVLRRGIKDFGCYFQLSYFAPHSSLNPAHAALFSKNLISVIRQCHYSTRNPNDALDLVVFLNGLPILTVEIKNQLTGQNVKHADKQYMIDRNPQGEPLLQFKRCLVHFSLDNDLVHMTTHLQGTETRYLPFNRGKDEGAGNPINPNGYSSSYLWEDVLAPTSLLELLGRFIHVETTERDSERIESLILPRYHQRDAVNKLVAHARDHGPGSSYLVQHSAGSGKSNTIAWLTHRLSTLHDAEDNRIFSTVLVITDRIILDRQLQDTVKQFERTAGAVTVIDKDSTQLAKALQDGEGIIVTTLQKFPFVVDKVSTLPGRTFAVIIDEAHSSQTDESTKHMKAVLAAHTLEEAEQQDSTTNDATPTGEDLINRSLAERGRQPNLSFFAFTATPKGKTLELFGVKQPDGEHKPFHIYTMRQAIEEGFILDVLQNYTTYGTYFNLLKTIADDPRYERSRTIALLRRYVDLHEYTISQKTAIMVEHFLSNTSTRIPDDRNRGQAKAMIVTRSRLHAVRYRLAFDRYLKSIGSPVRALVAFSGTVVDPDTELEYTEPGMNGFPESRTAEEFKKLSNRFLIVAEKFQTGFNQPFLHTMYVDKLLSGVAAVQTLSRLNRTHPRKTDTMVLDFANSVDDITESFKPFYRTTILSESTNPNKLYDLQHTLEDFNLYAPSEAASIAELFLRQGESAAALQPLLNTVIMRFNKLDDPKYSADFKHQLHSFVRLYAFLSQVIPFRDLDLERLYLFARLLLRKLPEQHDDLPTEALENVDLESYRIQQLSAGIIYLENPADPLDPLGDLSSSRISHSEWTTLSQIITDLNDRFGTDFTEADRVFFTELKTRLAANESLQAAVQVNARDNVQLLHDAIFGQVLSTMIESNFDMFKKINDDPAFGEAIRSRIFDLVYKELRSSNNKQHTLG